MTNQTSDVKVTRNYEAGIIALVAILLVVVIGGGIYLVSIAVGAAPIVSTIFGMMFAILTTVYIVSLMVQNRWAIQKISDTSMSTADAFAKALMSYKSQRNEAQPQPVMTTYMAPNRAPEIPAATSVPRLLTNGRPVGVKLQTLTPTGDVLTCSPAGLEVALKILADGEQPTREAFKKRGIYSSTEIAGVIMESLPVDRITVTLTHNKIHAKDCAECETREGLIDQIDRAISIEGALDADYAEEVTGYLVDEAGDTEYLRSANYGPDYAPDWGMRPRDKPERPAD